MMIKLGPVLLLFPYSRPKSFLASLYDKGRGERFWTGIEMGALIQDIGNSFAKCKIARHDAEIAVHAQNRSGSKRRGKETLDNCVDFVGPLLCVLGRKFC